MKNKFNLKPLEKTLKEILVPTWTQAGLFLSIALVIILLIFFDKIFRQSINNDIKTQQYFENTIDQYLISLSSVPFAEYITSILFWAFLGMIAYVVVLLIINVVITLSSNLAVRKREKLPGMFDSFSLVDEYRRLFWLILLFVIVILSFSLAAVWLNSIKIGVVDLNPVYFVYGLGLLTYNLYLLYMVGWTSIRNPNILARN